MIFDSEDSLYNSSTDSSTFTITHEIHKKLKMNFVIIWIIFTLFASAYQIESFIVYALAFSVVSSPFEVFIISSSFEVHQSFDFNKSRDISMIE